MRAHGGSENVILEWGRVSAKAMENCFHGSEVCGVMKRRKLRVDSKGSLAKVRAFRRGVILILGGISIKTH